MEVNRKGASGRTEDGREKDIEKKRERERVTGLSSECCAQSKIYALSQNCVVLR